MTACIIVAVLGVLMFAESHRLEASAASAEFLPADATVVDQPDGAQRFQSVAASAAGATLTKRTKSTRVPSAMLTTM